LNPIRAVISLIESAGTFRRSSRAASISARHAFASSGVHPASAANAISNIQKVNLIAAQAGEEAAQNLRDKIDILTGRMNALLDMTLAGQLTQDEYAQKKRSFLEEKKENEMKLAAFAREGANRFEPAINFYKEASYVGELAEGGKPDEKRDFLKKIGSNFLIGREKTFV